MPVGPAQREVDISAVPVLRDRLLRVLDNHGEGLVIDLTDTTYIDSAVVNMLFEVAEQLGLHQSGWWSWFPRTGSWTAS